MIIAQGVPMATSFSLISISLPTPFAKHEVETLLDCSFKKGIENNWLINNNILGQHKSGKPKLDRFASPLWISFWENENSRYLILKILNYDYLLLKLYLLRKQFYLEKREEFTKIPDSNKKQKNKMIEDMIKKETINFEQDKTLDVNKFKKANEGYINKYFKEICKIGGEK